MRSARDVTGVLVEFARTLRHAGLDVPEQRVSALLSAVDALDVSDARDTYWAGRATLCASREDIDIYDAAFVAFFRGMAPMSLLPRTAPPALSRLTLPFGGPGAVAEDSSDAVRIAATASDVELLRQRDIGALTPAERDQVRRMIALLAVGAAPRPSRRWQPSHGGPVDPGRTIRRILRNGGEPTRPLRRRPRPKPRRLTILIDVSGSMAPYADALLCFGHAAVRRAPNLTEVFTIGTRVTRVTRALRHRDPDAALRAAGAAVPDWHGGTRLADALKVFLDRWGRRGSARGAIVVICSDGWERGDPRPLAAEVAALARLAHRLIWVSPHQGKPGYEPLAGGIAACLPHVDEFVGGHTMAALEHLTQVIAGR
jgi:uncharacterized protein